MSTGTAPPDPGELLADLLGLPGRASAGMSEVEEAFVGRYGGPTEFQRAVGRVVRTGQSCLVVAPPASGKTEAAVMGLAELQRLSGGLILYVCPTRALINDVVARLEPGFGALDRTVVARHGESKRAASTYQQASCVVVTPESLQSLVVAGDEMLGRARYVVLDELHSVDGTVRGAQLRILLSKLRSSPLGSPLAVGITATVSDPATVAALWGAPGEPMQVVAQRPSVGSSSLDVLSGGVDGLRAWLRRPGAPAKVLAFANSRRRCDELFVALKGATTHVPLIHYSDLDRVDRLATEELLRSLPSVICIATSTLELGIDVGDIDVVALADAPWSTRNLLQRIGRGGRRKGRTRTVVFPGGDRDLLRLLAAVATPLEEDDDGVAPVYPSVLVQQALVSILADVKRRVGPTDLEAPLEVLGLPRIWAGKLLAHLRDLDILMPSPGARRYELNPASERLLGSDVWGNFPADGGGWELRTSGRRLASVQLPVRPFVGLGILFVGRRWRVVGVQRRTLALVPDEGVGSTESPVYHDSAPLVSWRMADGMRRLLENGELPDGVTLDDGVATRIDILRERSRGIDAGAVLATAGERGPRLLTFAGSRVNQLLAAMLPEALGADEIGVTLQRPMSARAWDGLASAVAAGDAVRSSWTRLAQQAPPNRWFQYLPSELQREEILSQFSGPAVSGRLAEVAGRQLVAADPGLVL